VRLWLSHELARQISHHALSEQPREACGVLLGAGEQVKRVIPITNTAGDPLRHYHMDERELARVIGGVDGLNLVGFYHSHPKSEPIPSPEDVKHAHYPATPYLIVGLKDLNQPQWAAWRIDYAQVSRVELHVGDAPPPLDHQALSTRARIAILTSALIAFILMIIISLSLLPPAPPIPR